jgi:hypothetical protein
MSPAARDRRVDGVEAPAVTPRPRHRAEPQRLMFVTVKLDLPRLAELAPVVQVVVVAARADHRRSVAEALAVPP